MKLFFSLLLKETKSYPTKVHHHWKRAISYSGNFKRIKNILLGQQITVFTDHKNLISENTQIEQVLRWRLLIEEFIPKLAHLAGHTVVADALSRLDLDFSSTIEESAMAEVFASEDIASVTYPWQLKQIIEFQQKDKELLQRAASNKDYHLKSFSGGRKM